MLKIEFSTTGGLAVFPGLQRPVAIDVDSLPAERRQALQRLLSESRFFELPASVGQPARGAADLQQHEITVEDGGRRHSVKLLVPAPEGPLRELAEQLGALVKEQRARR